jgi:hypothetical protein
VRIFLTASLSFLLAEFSARNFHSPEFRGTARNLRLHACGRETNDYSLRTGCCHRDKASR